VLFVFPIADPPCWQKQKRKPPSAETPAARFYITDEDPSSLAKVVNHSITQRSTISVMTGIPPYSSNIVCSIADGT
jgi:hypothetical protein